MMETRVIHVRVPIELHDGLKRRAASEERTVSYIAARLLKDALTSPSATPWEQSEAVRADLTRSLQKPDGEQL